MTFEEYWADPRFQRKKPNLRGSKKQAFGDNIYSRSGATEHWCQINSHHSLNDGSPNPENIETDTETDRILFGDEFVYWGGSGLELPEQFLSYGPGRETNGQTWGFWCNCGDFGEAAASAAGVELEDLPKTMGVNRPRLFGQYLREHGGIVNPQRIEAVKAPTVTDCESDVRADPLYKYCFPIPDRDGGKPTIPFKLSIVGSSAQCLNDLAEAHRPCRGRQ